MKHGIETLNDLAKEQGEEIQRLTAELEKALDSNLARAALAEQRDEIQSLRKLALLGYRVACEFAHQSGNFFDDEFRKPFEIVERQLKEADDVREPL